VSGRLERRVKNHLDCLNLRDLFRLEAPRWLPHRARDRFFDRDRCAARYRS
jgi:hypothetical protein